MYIHMYIQIFIYIHAHTYLLSVHGKSPPKHSSPLLTTKQKPQSSDIHKGRLPVQGTLVVQGLWS